MEQSALKRDLLPLVDEEYRLFSIKLKVSNHPILGIRTPMLRQYAKQIVDAPQFLKDFLSYQDPSYEEVCVAYLAIGKLKDDELVKHYVDALLPLNDGWATNDLLSSTLKQMGKHPDAYWDYLKEKLSDPYLFTRRFAIISMMDWYLKGDRAEEAIHLVSSLDTSEFYVMLAVAWFLATAMIGHESEVLPLLEKGKLSETTRKKTIQKAIESYRINDNLKDKLKSMR